MEGVRVVLSRLHEILLLTSPAAGVDVFSCVMEGVSQAVQVICLAYDDFRIDNSRAEDLCRLFVISKDSGVEKERQKSALLSWENKLIHDVLLGAPVASISFLSKSDFGIWFLHKGVLCFDGVREVDEILLQFGRLDSVVSEAIGRGGSRHRILLDVRDGCSVIRFLLDSMFDQVISLESGRDVLTRLLNRRYLQSVMLRELNYLRRNESSLSVLTIDIDSFKFINDSYGHAVGDEVIKRVATLVSESVRGGDYVFRLGGEEFLVVLVEASEIPVRRVAEKICRRVQKEIISINDGRSISVTVSIGVAEYDGHPDYTRLLKASDAALYVAKSNGRNQVVVSSSLHVN